jgi:hypothetical protein
VIAIINDGTTETLTGLHTYRVQINQEVICEFKHWREEGLAECLRRAAFAVERSKDQRLLEYIHALESDGQEPLEM